MEIDKKIKISYLTISVDDGSIYDLRVAGLLDKYDLEATFYIPGENPERNVLRLEDIKAISSRFEIGAHTYNHKPLKGLSNLEMSREIFDGKKWVEDITGKESLAFCYPRGEFDSKAVNIVRQAGFTGARTCFFNLVDFPKDPFCWGVSSHGFSHSPIIQIRHALLERNWRGFWNYFSVFKLASDWEQHFHRSVDYVERHGGIAHLYIHGWEIEQQGEWQKLECVFKHIASKSTFVRVTNGELFAMHKCWR